MNKIISIAPFCSKIIKKIFFVLLMCFLFCWNIFAQESTRIPGWILVWNDEFEEDMINTDKWRVEDAALIKNNELQYYNPDDVYLKKGCLVLRSQKRKKGKCDYTSGLVETKGKFTQTYGRFEVRAKLPKGQGIWPAHWLMNTVGTWPPEMDIVELIGDNPNKVYMTNHFGLYPKNRLEGGHYTGPDFSKDFHTFTLEWEPEELRWYIDGVKRFSTKKNIPNVPFYIVLNTAVGGDWPGDPDGTTVFPQYHVIDYVRVYQMDLKHSKFLISEAKNGKIILDPDMPRYDINSTVKLTPVPDIGYKFSSWSGALNGSEYPEKVIMDDNKKITANFVKDPNAPKLLSKGNQVKASSFEKNELMPEKAVDGDLNTRWSSKFSDPQWIYIDLGKICEVKAIRLNWEAARGKLYKIQMSNDTLNWKTIETIEDTVGQTKNIWVKNEKARYVRIYGEARATQWGYSLWEFEVFGEEQ
jgi:beta-glucanase (GH16 family)